MVDIKLRIEKLEELKKQTKDKFTKLLINHLKKRLYSTKELSLYEKLDFERISTLIEKEENRKILKGNKKLILPNQIFHLKVVMINGKKREIFVKGNTTLNKLNQLIQKEFDLEWGHLHEFEIGKYKFGPECDEWQEIFDSLDDFKLGAAIPIAGLNLGDSFKYLYDFGENIKFKIKIIDIKD